MLLLWKQQHYLSFYFLTYIYYNYTTDIITKTTPQISLPKLHHIYHYQNYTTDIITKTTPQISLLRLHHRYRDTYAICTLGSVYTFLSSYYRYYHPYALLTLDVCVCINFNAKIYHFINGDANTNAENGSECGFYTPQFEDKLPTWGRVSGHLRPSLRGVQPKILLFSSRYFVPIDHFHKEPGLKQ